MSQSLLERAASSANHGIGQRVDGAPSFRSRALVALAIAVMIGGFVYWHLTVLEPTTFAFDFTWPWRAARATAAGQNPYDVIRPTGRFPFDANFKYPLPAALVAMPFAWLSAPAAAAAFSALGAALLSYGLTAGGWGRLFVLVSPPFLINALSGQWSALLMAAALLPSISWLWICKPTVGAAMFAYRPTVRTVVATSVFIAISLLVLPTWPRDWFRSVQTDPGHHYVVPAMLRGGPLLLASIIRWRTAEGRLLLVLSVAPQILTFYSALPPMLVARTRIEALSLSIGSTLAWFGWEWSRHGRLIEDSGPTYAGNWMLWLCYVPALVIVLRRPNVGAVSVSIERTAAHLPGWLRGKPLESHHHPSKR